MQPVATPVENHGDKAKIACAYDNIATVRFRKTLCKKCRNTLIKLDKSHENRVREFVGASAVV